MINEFKKVHDIDTIKASTEGPADLDGSDLDPGLKKVFLNID